MLCANLVAMGYDFTEVAQQLAHRGYTGRSTVRIIICLVQTMTLSL